ncbi:MAG TPA: TVP38/TMEM64 family protein [Desulfobacteraceae bacterium]|nr:TVP38/TMEM64 family protein [Desulfobacteraceae bacterium]
MKPRSVNKLLIAALIIALMILFAVFDLHQYMTLASLKQRQAQFVELYAQYHLGVIAAYMLLYILVAALSLPGAAVMSLAGGALFGLVVGTLVVSFASTIGATLACIAARYLLRDWSRKLLGLYSARRASTSEEQHG